MTNREEVNRLASKITGEKVEAATTNEAIHKITEGGAFWVVVYSTTAEFSELNAGEMTVITDSPETMELAFSLSQPSETKQSEYALVFKAGETTSLAVTVPAGYTLNWADGEPEWTAGNVYEISFLSLNTAINENKVIGVLYKEYTEEV